MQTVAYMYEVNEDKNFVRRFTSSDFFEDIDKIGVSFLDDIPEKDVLKEFLPALFNVLRSYGAEAAIPDKSVCSSEGFYEDTPYVIFPEDFKENYFSERFQDLKDKVYNLSLQDFTHSANAYDLQKIIEDDFGDKICTDDGIFSFDYWLREEMEPQKKYYFGNIFSLH